jgi:glutamyl-tRNA reductase
MSEAVCRDISTFFVVGINYKKSDAAIRGSFSVNADQYEQLVFNAPQYKIQHFFVLSTCNRTEIYGFAEKADQLSQLLCSVTEGSLDNFRVMAYQKSGIDGIEHLFNVAAGLDSQILGDYEIVGQLKQSFKFSKERFCVDAYLERLVNEVLQASKKIRTTTILSGGTVSVSYAAVQYIKNYFSSLEGKKIVLIGTGKIGSNTCKNLVDYLPETSVTLLNRTADKAKLLAEKYGVLHNVMEQLPQCISSADVIMVATNAEAVMVNKSMLCNNSQQLLIDLSVPFNIDVDVKELPQVCLVNVDDLSKINDETLQRRKDEVPKVKIIIRDHLEAFNDWHEMRKYVPILKTAKIQLQKIYLGYDNIDTSFLELDKPRQVAAENIQKVINNMAVKMRHQHQPGCHCIEAMNNFMTIAAHNN